MDPLTGAALISAGSSLFNGLFSGLLSNDQQSTSLAMNRESQRWQSAEWSRRFGIESNHQWALYNQQMQDWFKMQSRTYQDNLSLQQRLSEFNMNLEREEYDRRMNAYQTPEAQARMLMEAGYNPLLAQGLSGGSQPSPSVNGGSGMSSPGFPGMPQSPNPGDPSAYGVTPTQVGSSQMLEAVSNMIEKLSVAAKNGMDTYEAKTLLQEKLRSFILQNNGQELLNYSQKIDNFVNDNIKNIKVKKAFQEYQNSIAQELLLKNMSDKEAADTLLKFSQKFFTDIESKVKGEDLFQLRILSQHYEDSILAYIRNLKTTSVKNTAEARSANAQAIYYRSAADYNSALAKTENDLRDGRITLQDLGVELQKITNWNAQQDKTKRMQYIPEEYGAYEASLKQQGLVSEKMAADLERARKENDFYEYNQLLNAIGVAAGAYSNFSGGSAQMLNALSGQQRVDIQRRATQIYERDVHQRGRNHTRSVFDADGRIQGFYNDVYY